MTIIAIDCKGKILMLSNHQINISNIEKIEIYDYYSFLERSVAI